VAFKATGHLLHRFLKCRERFRRRAIQHDANHHQRPQIQRTRIEQRNNPLDQPQLLEPFHAAQAGRRAEVYLGREGHVGDRRIALERPENRAISAIQGVARRSRRRVRALLQFCFALFHFQEIKRLLIRSTIS